MHSLPNQKQQRGFSLVELLLVLGVLAILLVAAFVVFPQVRDRNQANAEVTNLTTTKAGINNLYASKGGVYTGLTNTVAINARVYPTSMTASGSSLSSWGGAVTTAVDGSNPRRFTITYADVPQGVCLGLVSGAASNFEQIEVGETPVITDSAGEAAELSAGGQFNPAEAATACGTATGPVDVVFTSN